MTHRPDPAVPGKSRRPPVASDGGLLVSWLSSPPPAPGEASFALVWPSGQGDEIGIVATTLDEAWTSIRRNAKGPGRPLRITEVEENGATALVIEGLDGGPVTLVSEPEIAEGVLAVVADRQADPGPIRAALAALLPDMSLTFHDPAPV